MSASSAILWTLLLPLLLLWVASTVVVALAFDRATSRLGDGALSLEAWLLYASAGAATGGLLGSMLVVRDFVLLAEGRPEMSRLLLVGAPGMLLGAAFACLLALAAVHWRR
jgi:hypothetical protein